MGPRLHPAGAVRSRGQLDGVDGPIGSWRSWAKGANWAGDRANRATSLPGHSGQRRALSRGSRG